MPTQRKPEGTALSHLMEVRAAGSLAWKYSGILLSLGMDPEEMRQRIVEHLYSVKSQYSPAIAQYSTWCWHVGRQFVRNSIASLEVRQRRMSMFQLPARSYRQRRAVDVEELVRKLMRCVSPRRRQMVTEWAAGRTLKEMARRHRLTRERCRQIVFRALSLMKVEAMRIAHAAGMSADECWSDLLCPR